MLSTGDCLADSSALETDGLCGQFRAKWMYIADWLVIALFLPVIIYPAFLSKSRHERRSASEQFVAGRSMGWLVLGGSLAATALSPDTPILVSGAFYNGGLAENWFWLAGIPGALATLFFFARYWRRTGVLTKLEIITFRYGDTQTTRSFRAGMALLDAGLINILVLASVTYATHIAITQFFNLPEADLFELGAVGISYADAVTIGMFAVTVFYTYLSGFRAVVRTDTVQLAVAILASIVVAGFALSAGINEFGSYANLVAQLPPDHPGFELFRFEDASIFLILLFRWWQIAPGDGLFVQRLVSARSEQDAVLTALSYTVIHYALRAWPWFAIGAVALIYAPYLQDGEHAFAAIAKRFLPAGGLGLLIVALWAAFMSTVDSRLNWGASYFVNDIYGAFGGDRQGARARIVEGLCIAAISAAALTLALSSAFSSIIGVYKYLILIQAGSALVAIARWYWWRSTISAEFAALCSSFLVGNALFVIIDVSDNAGFAAAIAINSVLSGLITVAVSYLTSRRGPDDAAIRFQQEVQIGGPGWRAAGLPSLATSANAPLFRQVLFWLAANVMIYAFIVMIAGAAVLKFANAALAGLLVTVSMAWLWRNREEMRHLLRY